MADWREEIRDLVKELGHEHKDKPFQLSSGEMSYDYIDGKRVIASGANLRKVAEAVISQTKDLGIEFDAVGGLTMGADPIAHAVSLLTDKQWFSVRKEPKAHGKQQRIEGALLTRGLRILVVDDVITTGKSIIQALGALELLGVDVVLAIAIVDRGETARTAIENRGIRYAPLLTYRDLEIAPVDGRVRA